MNSNLPIFVKIESIDDFNRAIIALKKKICEAREILYKLTRLSAEEKLRISAWNTRIETINERIKTLEAVLAGME